MAERPTGAGERRDRTLADAEARALGQPTSPPPKPLPKPSGFMETARKALEGLGVKHNVDGKDSERP